jgi:hypothetical protein
MRVARHFYSSSPGMFFAALVISRKSVFSHNEFMRFAVKGASLFNHFS